MFHRSSNVPDPLIARGLEGEIPGLWVDGAPSEPKTVYGYGLELLLGPVLLELVV